MAHNRSPSLIFRFIDQALWDSILRSGKGYRFSAAPNRSIDAPRWMAILHNHDLPLQNMHLASVFRAKAPVPLGADLAVAHRLVSGLEIVSAAVGAAVESASEPGTK
jgi:hypothetical protein